MKSKPTSKSTILLIIPPMTQLNTPYPATTVLTGYLREKGFNVFQRDLSIELALRILSKSGVTEIQKQISKIQNPKHIGPATASFLSQFERIQETIEPTIQFLQSGDPTLALRICQGGFLPEGPSFQALGQISEAYDENEDPLVHAFGGLGIQDRAKYLASLFVDDVMAVVSESIDPDFQISRYGEKLAASQPTFGPLEKKLKGKKTLIDDWLKELTLKLIKEVQPNIVGITAPFPGNVYGAFSIAKTIKEKSPPIKTILGGGYVNTELREITEPKVFQYFDFLTYDDGERSFELLIEHLNGKKKETDLLRVRLLEGKKVRWIQNPLEHDVPQSRAGYPTYDGLPIQKYLSIFEMLNPMHRIWSDGRWNKLMLAHGCYWKKCSFCDVSLDYIGRYDPSGADLIIDRMEKIIAETGQRGFHFVDEAAPPAVLKALAKRLIERKVVVTWWGNIRFDKFFTDEVCSLLARSGCVAVSGGLEVASDRLLKLINKGVTIEQVAQVTHSFSNNGILVHAYLMYGYATQTVQETIDSLELVRQLFSLNCIQSAYWHRFSVTAHSPVGADPKKYGITLHPPKKITFAKNDIPFTDKTKIDHSKLGEGLKRALYNYMHGMGFENEVHDWFSIKVPKSKIPHDRISKALGATTTTYDSALQQF